MMVISVAMWYSELIQDNYNQIVKKATKFGKEAKDWKTRYARKKKELEQLQEENLKEETDSVAMVEMESKVKELTQERDMLVGKSIEYLREIEAKTDKITELSMQLEIDSHQSESLRESARLDQDAALRASEKLKDATEEVERLAK